MTVKFVDRHRTGWMPVVEASEGIEQDVACHRKVKLGKVVEFEGMVSSYVLPDDEAGTCPVNSNDDDRHSLHHHGQERLRLRRAGTGTEMQPGMRSSFMSLIHSATRYGRPGTGRTDD